MDYQYGNVLSVCSRIATAARFSKHDYEFFSDRKRVGTSVSRGDVEGFTGLPVFLYLQGLLNQFDRRAENG